MVKDEIKQYSNTVRRISLRCFTSSDRNLMTNFYQPANSLPLIDDYLCTAKKGQMAYEVSNTSFRSPQFNNYVYTASMYLNAPYFL